MKNYLLLAALSGAMALQHGAASAANQVDRHAIGISRTAPAKTMRGTIRGHDSADYTVRLRRGQTLSVSLKTNLRSNYFNITGPGGGNAVFTGSRDGNSYRGNIRQSGDYTIHVYLMRNAARRGESARYALSVAVRN